MKFPGLFLRTLLLCATTSASAAATERHFGYGYESAVLNPGLAQLSPWTTARVGRADYYSRLEARLGFELGVLRNLQAALFWDVSSTTADVRVDPAVHSSRLSTTDFESLSLQLKYKFSDPTTDALGFALLLEGRGGPSLAAFEARAIVDDQLGALLLVCNVFGAGIEPLEPHEKFVTSFGANAGAGYFVTPNLVTSLEVRNENRYVSQLEAALLYLGPTISYASTRYWLTLAVQPQVFAFKGATAGYHLDLTRNEYVQARLLLGFPL